jgi:Leucine-rich repeat (LRR) protein
LRVLMLGKNRITKIANLEKLTKLDVLDLHSNGITAIEVRRARVCVCASIIFMKHVKFSYLVLAFFIIVDFVFFSFFQIKSNS